MDLKVDMPIQIFVTVIFPITKINLITIRTEIDYKNLFNPQKKPYELLVHLQQAINNLDLEHIQMVIDEMGEIEQSLAQTIETYVKNFQSEKLLDLIASLSDE